VDNVRPSMAGEPPTSTRRPNVVSRARGSGTEAMIG